MATPTSAATAYATPADALVFFDGRVLGDLLGDYGVRVDSALIPSDPTLAALLLSASGEVEAAALCGRRYDVLDLQALTGASLQLMKRIVVYAAMGQALWRRNVAAPKPDVLQWAEQHLKALRQGEEIFGFVEAQNAGKESLVTRRPGDETNGRPRIVERAARYFGGWSWRGRW